MRVTDVLSSFAVPFVYIVHNGARTRLNTSVPKQYQQRYSVTFMCITRCFSRLIRLSYFQWNKRIADSKQLLNANRHLWMFKRNLQHIQEELWMFDLVWPCHSGALPYCSIVLDKVLVTSPTISAQIGAVASISSFRQDLREKNFVNKSLNLAWNPPGRFGPIKAAFETNSGDKAKRFGILL